MTKTTFLKLSQVADQLGCSRAHVFNLCKRGEIPFVKVGNRHRISEKTLTNYMIANGYLQAEV